MISIEAPICVSKYSSEIDEKFELDFINVCRDVFGEATMNEETFRRKYIENIYGVSVLIVVYVEDVPVAARAFWRNDISGRIAYQPVDTSVREGYRGKGIFALMTKAALELIAPEDIVYNFPNTDSYQQYIKLGWKVVKSYRPNILYSAKRYLKEHPLPIDDEYLKWHILPRKNEFNIKKLNGSLFLTKKHGFGRQFVIGRIDMANAPYFKSMLSPILLFWSEKKNCFNKKKSVLNIVVKALKKDQYICVPTFKMDAL